MERNDLVKLLDTIFIPFNYKRKGNNWVNNQGEIIKMINLQKSSYSNTFYLNYGFVLKSIPLGDSRMHIFLGLGSVDSKENERIKALLCLENEIDDSERKSALADIFRNDLVKKLQSKNTEADILQYLQSLPHLNGIPSTVKKHFNLEVD